MITNAILLSPDRSAALPNARIQTDDGSITAVGSCSVDVSRAEAIEARRGYVIAGLIDCQVHLYRATGLKRRRIDYFERLYVGYLAQLPCSFRFKDVASIIEPTATAHANQRFETAPAQPRVYHYGQGVAPSKGFMALELDGEPIG